MDTYNKIRDFVGTYISLGSYTLKVNDYFLDSFKDISVKDKFLVGILIDADKNELDFFDEVITNVYDKKSFSGGGCLYRIILSEEEFKELIPKLRDFSITDYSITYFNVSHSAFLNSNQYFSEKLHIDTSDRLYKFGYTVLDRYNIRHVYEILDGSGFFVAIDLYSNNLETRETTKMMLAQYCEEFLLLDVGWGYYILLAKNINSKFMAKFNLVKERLEADIVWLVIGTEYLKNFEE